MLLSDELLEHVPYEYVANPEARTTIYCVSCLDFVKIGISRQFALRFRDLQGANPFPVEREFSATVCAAAALWTEGAIHEALHQYRHHGEWFRCGSEQVRSPFQAAIRKASALEREWGERLRDYRSRVTREFFDVNRPDPNPAVTI